MLLVIGWWLVGVFNKQLTTNNQVSERRSSPGSDTGFPPYFCDFNHVQQQS